jgi:class 3 adenylate cyclase/tetratricopeptide (TPR) repeat protein
MHRLIPPFILDNFKAGNLRGSFNGVGLLVDVSGFSIMTDTLVHYGPHGSEVLADVMRGVFDPMVKSVFEQGGILVGFAGDAISAVFPEENTPEKACTRALAVAQNIQEFLAQKELVTTPFGDFKISVKIGLGFGQVSWRIVKTPDEKRAIYYFRGPALKKAVVALKQANSSEIILCNQIYKTLKNTIAASPIEDMFKLIEYNGEFPRPGNLDFHPPDPGLAKTFTSNADVPEGQFGEFRPAVNLFISVQQDEDKVDLEPLILQVMRKQDRYGGLLCRPDFGDKGVNLLLFWGAPIAQENDIVRALNFILELLFESEVPIKAGVTYRQAYAGYMGGPLQEEYTCYGWGVSLAVRMMSAAGTGDIWVDEEVARNADRMFQVQHIGQQRFKGFSREQKVFQLVRRKENVPEVFTGDFVGREDELESLNRFISPVWDGKFAGLVSIIGEPGIGKSRLLHALQTSLAFENRDFHWALCQADKIVRSSLNPFRYWLKNYFSFSEMKTEDENKQAFCARLDGLIETLEDEELGQSLQRTRSFLGALLDLHWQGTLFEQLDAQGRYENTLIGLSTLLRAVSLGNPLIIVFEDAHYLDEDTRSFLPYLMRTLTAESKKNYPISILINSRSEIDSIAIDSAPYQTIKVDKLSLENLEQLARNSLGGDISPELVDILEKRADGNPFFAEQILRYLGDESRLEIGEQGWQLAGKTSPDAIPTDVNAILISRLDRLPGEVKEVVLTSAVLGREFEIRLLAEVLEAKEHLPEIARLAVEAEIWAGPTETRYIFRQALLQDTAYNMQMPARQRQLHRFAAQAIEKLYADQLPSQYSQIAYHQEKAGLIEEARQSYRLAGDTSLQAYQNSLAAEYYTHALKLTSLEDEQDRVELLFKREAAYAILGQHTAQKQDLATTELLVERLQIKRNHAILAQRQMDYAFNTGNYKKAEEIAVEAIRFADETGSLEIAVRIYENLPVALARQNKVKEAIQVAQRGISLARQIGNQIHEGKILNDIGLIMLQERDSNKAHKHFTQSLEIARQTGDRRLEAQALNNLGNIAGMIRRELPAAKELFESELDIVREIGDRKGEGFALSNLGWISAMQGDFTNARTYQEQALTIARETGNRYQESFSLMNLSMLAVSQEDFSHACDYAQQALDLSRRIGDRSVEAWSLTFLGHAYVGMNELVSAKDSYQQAFNIREELEQASLGIEPLAGLAHTAYLANNIQSAIKHANTIMDYLDSGGTLEGTEEPTRIYLSIYLVLKDVHDPRSDKVLDSAYNLLMNQASMLGDSGSRDMYVHNVPWRQQIAELWEARKIKRSEK